MKISKINFSLFVGLIVVSILAFLKVIGSYYFIGVVVIILLLYLHLRYSKKKITNTLEVSSLEQSDIEKLKKAILYMEDYHIPMSECYFLDEDGRRVNLINGEDLLYVGWSNTWKNEKITSLKILGSREFLINERKVYLSEIDFDD